MKIQVALYLIQANLVILSNYSFMEGLDFFFLRSDRNEARDTMSFELIMQLIYLKLEM